jgi:hypothetical protein
VCESQPAPLRFSPKQKIKLRPLRRFVAELDAFYARAYGLDACLDRDLALGKLGDHEIIGSPWGNREALKEIAMSQGHNHLNHATWECKYHVVLTPKYRRKALFGQNPAALGHYSARLLGARSARSRRAPAAPPCAYADIDPAEIFSVGADRISQREGLDLDWAECGTQRCGIFWATNSGPGATSSRP